MDCSVAFDVINCSCGGTYALTKAYVENKRMYGGDWHCPYCEVGWGFKGSLLAKEKKAREEAETRLATERVLHEHTRNRLTHTQASRNSIKGQVTKLKNSVAQGRCPLCKKQFVNLANHMAGIHPGWHGVKTDE